MFLLDLNALANPIGHQALLDLDAVLSKLVDGKRVHPFLSRYEFYMLG